LFVGVNTVVAVPVALVDPEEGETVPWALVVQAIGAPEIPRLPVVVRVTIGLHAADPAVKVLVWHESVPLHVIARAAAAPTEYSVSDGPR